jgi:FkbM family methyltransferase
MYYGQNLEDKTISELINSKYGNDFVGNILDIGANDGITLSNSRYFYERGWTAYLIEAGKTPFQLLESNTKSFANVNKYNCALSYQDGTMNFYESSNLLNEHDKGLVSTLIPNETTKWRNAGIKYEEYQVPCFTWKTFLNNYFPNKLNFDVISIDIEGMDYEILSQMNLDELGCKILCIEFNGLEMNKYVDFVGKFNMHLVNQNAENLIFIK